MNRDHVGMIFRFLPKEEQEELRNLNPEDIEFYFERISQWRLFDSTIEYVEFAYRPKGFLSWAEIAESIAQRCNGKTVKIHNCRNLVRENFTMPDTDVWQKYAILSRPDYGFEVVE